MNDSQGDHITNPDRLECSVEYFSQRRIVKVIRRGITEAARYMNTKETKFYESVIRTKFIPPIYESISGPASEESRRSVRLITITPASIMQQITAKPIWQRRTIILSLPGTVVDIHSLFIVSSKAIKNISIYVPTGRQPAFLHSEIASDEHEDCWALCC